MNKQPILEHVFDVTIHVEKPILAGADGQHGRRQIVAIKGGQVTGRINGQLLPGGTDCQLIRPDGNVEISARYAARLDDGATVFIEAWGVRSVDPAFAAEAAQGKVIDPSHIYFVTNCKLEAFDEAYKWLEDKVYVAHSIKIDGCVTQRFYRVQVK